MEARDRDRPMGARGPDPAYEPEGHAALCGLLAQAARHLESSDFRSASAKLEEACERAETLREENESPSLTDPGTSRVRRTFADARPVPEGAEIRPRHTGSRDT